MSPSKRIIVNVIATYARSLYGIALGLFTSRWALQALGQVDFGLLGVVGGLTGFMTFLNSLLSISTARFFAFSVGQQQIAGNAEDGLRECRDWFSAAFSIHFVLGCVLVVIGYPIGLWAVKNYLTIPLERIPACIWVWRITCLNCFVGMVNVPFGAMYNAKQEIAEVTCYSFFTATANAIFMYYTITHPGDWLVRYAVWGSILTLLPQIIMIFRAFVVFQECRFTRDGFGNKKRIGQMFGFSFAQFLASFASTVSGMVGNIAVNKMLGPACNAAAAIGDKLSTQTLSLGSSIMGALTPAITNAAGAGQHDRMRMLAFQSCKFSCVFVLIFSIPLSFEVNEVMRLWLKNPPEGAGTLCVLLMAGFIVERSTGALTSAIDALGKIAVFKITMGIFGFLPVVFVVLFIKMGFGVPALGLSYVASRFPLAMVRLYFARKLAGVSVRKWVREVCMPICLLGMSVCAAAWIPRLFMQQSFARIVMTTIVSELILLPVAWFFALTANERSFVAGRVIAMLKSPRK